MEVVLCSHNSYALGNNRLKAGLISSWLANAFNVTWFLKLSMLLNTFLCICSELIGVNERSITKTWFRVRNAIAHQKLCRWLGPSIIASTETWIIDLLHNAGSSQNVEKQHGGEDLFDRNRKLSNSSWKGDLGVGRRTLRSLGQRTRWINRPQEELNDGKSTPWLTDYPHSRTSGTPWGCTPVPVPANLCISWKRKNLIGPFAGRAMGLFL